MPQSVRLLCTNDFSGSFRPALTSYGCLPGALGLIGTIGKLRGLGPSLWIDAGDLVDGALASLTDGRGGFEAAASFPIDVAVPGNHELEWGVEHYRKYSRKLPFPSLCANVDLGLPKSTLLETEAGAVGILGLNHTKLRSITPVDNSFRGAELDVLIVKEAAELRRKGATWVVVVLHDGIAFGLESTAEPAAWVAPDTRADTTELKIIVEPWLRYIDGLVLGHTLTRWFGSLNGVPVAQPFPFGAEVGVIELHRGKPGSTYGVLAECGGRWEGTGYQLLEDMASIMLGTLDSPLVMTANGNCSLLRTVSEVARVATGADAGLMTIWDCYCRQPVVANVLSYVAQGKFDELTLRELMPYPDDELAVIELESRELTRLPMLASLPYMTVDGISRSPEANHKQFLRVAVRKVLADLISGWLDRPIPKTLTGISLREAVRSSLRERTG